MSACLLCGGARRTRCFAASDRLYHTTDQEFAVVRCGDCGLLRLDPQPAPEELQPLLSRQLLVRAGSRAPPAAWRRPIAAWCCATMCGSWSAALRGSRRARAAARCGLRRRTVPGHDAGARGSRGGAGFFARSGGDRLAAARRPGDLRELGARAASRAGSFGGITMFHVLEHLYDPARLPGGRARTAGAGRAADRAGAQCGVAGSSGCWAGAGTAWTCRATCSIFATAIWRRLLASRGFEVVRRKYFSLRDNPAGLASSAGAGARPDGAARAPARPEAGARAWQGPGVFRAGGRRAALRRGSKPLAAPGPP